LDRRGGKDELAQYVTQLYVRVLWVVMPVAWIIRNVLAGGDLLDSDGIAYVDIAYQCVRGNWRALVNARWGTGYPALLSFWLSALRPTAYREIMAVRVFNCLAMVGALFCFRFFLNALVDRSIAASAGEDRGAALPRWVLQAVGYTLFFWTTIELFPLYVNGPDIFVLSALLLAGGISLRILQGKNGWINYAMLGAVLGVGYLIKAPVLTLSPVFFLTTFLGTYRRPRFIGGLLLSLLVLVTISAPLIYALSKDKGRFTPGGSGAIAYAEAVNYIDSTVYWRGEPQGSGVPKHPLRKPLDVPPVYEYARHDSSTYTLWYDQSYWYDGVRPHIEWKRQLNVIHIGLRGYYGIIFEQLGALVAGYIVLAIAGGSLRSLATRVLEAFPLWGPAIAGLAMYALVHVEPRFLNAFIILAWAACFLSLRLERSGIMAALIRAVVPAIIFVLGIQILVTVGHNASEFASLDEYPDWEVAQRLHSMGINGGDSVSFVGGVLIDHLWAHLARVSVVSEVPRVGESTFWSGAPDLRYKVFRLFALSGAKAVVTRDVPYVRISDGWEQVAGTDYFILRLQPPL
jgi:hypothetical protein